MHPDQGGELGRGCVRQADATVAPSRPGSPPGPWSASQGSRSPLGAVCLLPLFRQTASFGAQMDACRVSGNLWCLVMRGSPGDTWGGVSGRGGALCPPPRLKCGRQAGGTPGDADVGGLAWTPGWGSSWHKAQGNLL